MNRSRDRLEQMLAAAQLARSYVEGMSKEEFLADTRTQQAVVMNLIIIGEAAARLIQNDAALAVARPELKLELMRGMRNRIAHGYFEINMEVVWDTVRETVLELARALPAVIEAA